MTTDPPPWATPRPDDDPATPHPKPTPAPDPPAADPSLTDPSVADPRATDPPAADRPAADPPGRSEPPLFGHDDDRLFRGRPAPRPRARQDPPAIPRIRRDVNGGFTHVNGTPSGTPPPSRRPPGAPSRGGESRGGPSGAPQNTGPRGTPPRGRRPSARPSTPNRPEQAEPTAPGTDPHVGVIAGLVRVTAAALPSRSAPGLLAISTAALISIAAWAGRSLTGGVSIGLLLAGVLVPLLLVAAVAAAQRWFPAAAGSHAVWEFTVRVAHGATVHVVLRTDAPRDSLRSGDLVRLTPARSGLLARAPRTGRATQAVPGRGVSVRAVEVLAALDGPVVRRITATAALPPAQVLGLALAVVLLAATVIAVFTV